MSAAGQSGSGPNDMNTFLRLSFSTIALAAAGCAAIPSHTQLSTSNPASLYASEAAFPAAQPILMTGENYAMAPQAEGKSMEMDMQKDMPAPQHGDQKPAIPHPHEHHQDNSTKQ